MLNLAAIHEAIAAAIPERECLVYGDRRISWAPFTDRTRRLADVTVIGGISTLEDRLSNTKIEFFRVDKMLGEIRYR